MLQIMSDLDLQHIIHALPSLHMRLAVLPCRRVVELQSTQTSTCHKEESNVLDIIDFLLVCVLEDRYCQESPENICYRLLTLKIFNISRLLTTEAHVISLVCAINGSQTYDRGQQSPHDIPPWKTKLHQGQNPGSDQVYTTKYYIGSAYSDG